MHQVSEKIYNVLTWSITGVGIVVNFESIKSIILFAGALILLVLQIRLHLIKIKKENKNEKP